MTSQYDRLILKMSVPDHVPDWYYGLGLCLEGSDLGLGLEILALTIHHWKLIGLPITNKQQLLTITVYTGHIFTLRQLFIVRCVNNLTPFRPFAVQVEQTVINRDFSQM